MQTVLQDVGYDRVGMENKGLCIDMDTTSSTSRDALTAPCKDNEFTHHFHNQGRFKESAKWSS